MRVRYAFLRKLLLLATVCSLIPLLMAGDGGCGGKAGGGGPEGGGGLSSKRCDECGGMGQISNGEGRVDFDGKYITETIRRKCTTCGGTGKTK